MKRDLLLEQALIFRMEGAGSELLIPLSVPKA